MKNLYKFLGLIFILSINCLSYGEINIDDKSFIKNDIFNIGNFIEQLPIQSIKTLRIDTSELISKYDKEERIAKDKFHFVDTKILDCKIRGFINITEINYCFVNGDVNYQGHTYKNEFSTYGFRTINGYQFNEHFSVGIGIGIDNYYNSYLQKNITFLPVTFDARVAILKGKISPIFIANVGYGIRLSDNTKGIVINPQIGIKKNVLKTSAIMLNIGYKWMERTVSWPAGLGYNNQTIYDSTNVFYKFITFSLGYSF